MKYKLNSYLAMVLLVLSISGCGGITLALLGAGAGVGMSYSIDGYVYKTLLVPTHKAEKASVRALDHMGIAVTAKKTHESGTLMVFGRVDNRNVIIRLEPLSERSTQIRTQVRKPSVILQDKATAVAIIVETEKVLTKG